MFNCAAADDFEGSAFSSHFLYFDTFEGYRNHAKFLRDHINNIG